MARHPGAEEMIEQASSASAVAEILEFNRDRNSKLIRLNPGTGKPDCAMAYPRSFTTPGLTAAMMP